MRKKLGILLALGTLVLPAWAQTLTFSGSIGMDFTFSFGTPPAMQSALTLAMDAGRGGVQSRTVFSLSGLEAEYLWLWLKFPEVGVTLKTGLTFDPCFSRWTLNVSGGCCPFFLGGWFFLGNLAQACQTPNYTVGLVLDFGVGGEPGFLARTLIGFGVRDIENLIDDNPWTDVKLVSGWYFEEFLLHVAWSSACWRLYTTWSLTSYTSPTALKFGEMGLSYRFLDPLVELGAALRLNSSFSLEWAKLWLGVTIAPVSVYSATGFDFTNVLWQEIGLRIQFAQVLIYSVTRINFVSSPPLAVLVGFELRF